MKRKKLITMGMIVSMCIGLMGCNATKNDRILSTEQKELAAEVAADNNSVSQDAVTELSELNKFIGMPLNEFLDEAGITQVTNAGCFANEATDYPGAYDSDGNYLFAYAGSAPKTPVDLDKSRISPKSIASVKTSVDNQEVDIMFVNEAESAISYADAVVIGYICYDANDNTLAYIQSEVTDNENCHEAYKTESVLTNDNMIHIYRTSTDEYIYAKAYSGITFYAGNSTKEQHYYDDTAIVLQAEDDVIDKGTKNGLYELTSYTMGNTVYNVSEITDSDGYIIASGVGTDDFYAKCLYISSSGYDTSVYGSGYIYDHLNTMSEERFNELQSDIKSLSDYKLMIDNDSCAAYVYYGSSLTKAYVFNKDNDITWYYETLIGSSNSDKYSLDDLLNSISSMNNTVGRYISK